MNHLVLCIATLHLFQYGNGQIPSPANTTVPVNFKEKPKNDAWPGTYNDGRNDRHILGDWLLTGCWNNTACSVNFSRNDHNEYEYEGFDGWYNNVAQPDRGAIDRPLLRRWPAAYEDGSYLPAGVRRPNPLTLSEKLLKGDPGTQSKTGKNALLVFFGQQVVEEILDAQRAACPPEYFNIPIPEGHPFRTGQPGHTEMPVQRTRYDQRTGYSPNNPRQQLNEITPYIDGGLFYGITKQWSDQLRTYENGTVDPDGCLASSHDGLFPAYNTARLPMANPPPPFYHSVYIKSHETAKVSRFFKLGNPRGNENSFLLTFGVMWFRWHNYLAKRIRHNNPSWTSEKVFNEARKWVIATQQNIYMYEWLPAWLLTSLPSYRRYDPTIDPQIDQFFQAAAFRFGHTLVVPGVYLRDYIRNGCRYKYDTWGRNAVRTCNIFWRPQEPMLTKTSNISGELIDIDRLLMGMSVQLSEREDHKIVEDLRGNVFGPLEFPRRDLMALNIQRARDHGLPDYNTAREAFGLPRVGFEYFTNVEKHILDDFKDLYNNSTDDIDPWIGGILETDDRPGHLFRTIILDQFERIRDGDRFWFENAANRLFTTDEIRRIKQLNIYDIIMAVTKMDSNDIPKSPFSVPLVGDDVLIKECNLSSSHCSLQGSMRECYHLEQLNQERLNESCLKGDSYDYFNNSKTSYILTFSFIVAFIVGLIGLTWFLIKKRNEELNILRIMSDRRSSFPNEFNSMYPRYIVREWLGDVIPLRPVAIVIKEEVKQLAVVSPLGMVLRVIYFPSSNESVVVYQITDSPYLIIKCIHNYDLVIQFESNQWRNEFLRDFEAFLARAKLNRENITTINLSNGLKKVVTKAIRQKRLEMFFRVLFAQGFKEKASKTELLKVDAAVGAEMVHTELTISEFAECLNMRPKHEFIQRMFALVDQDKNGFISFREFIDLLVIFANGTEEEKLRLLFDMYDINAEGHLSKETFVNMLKSFLATVGGQIDDAKLQRTVETMIEQAGVRNRSKLTFDDFKKLVGTNISHLGRARLEFRGANKTNRASHLDAARDTIQSIYSSQREIQERFQGEINDRDGDSEVTQRTLDEEQEKNIKSHKSKEKDTLFKKICKLIELKSKEIFWFSLYTLVLLAIFAERAYYYTVEREHSGLRRIAGYGVTMTRGAASAMMFTYSSLLITMCRNSISLLRGTVFNKYFPFDAMVEFHKYIAWWAAFFTLVHIIGHAFNFYHISTQTADDLTCLFRNFFHSTHELPKFHYWCWQTITGFTGIILTIIWATIYIFAQNIARRKIYNWFWYTHNFYLFFYIFMVLHGIGRLIQEPFFYYFFLGPVILFTVDSLVSISRKKIAIPILRVEILPSNVTMLEIRKPENFTYKAGQWVRIACLKLNKSEYHPFTLSSSPDEDTLTVHIRTVGPWTSNIRSVYDTTLKQMRTLPMIFLDGPYGQAHEDWGNFDVSILIGGGIGVTPFASILKDIVSRSRTSGHCKKVYFIWVSRTQKQFEWLVDIIREIENKDRTKTISCHIFITQFYEKFDLRTTFLYICERHYQRIAGRSLFTNLKAVTHFGRPNFTSFFKTTADKHSTAKSFGVFSCGPPAMTTSVQKACNKINIRNQRRFEHYYKNF